MPWRNSPEELSRASHIELKSAPHADTIGSGINPVSHPFLRGSFQNPMALSVLPACSEGAV